jgi:prepilin-type N-terminal cleavage/methylation domain-containing protein
MYLTKRKSGFTLIELLVVIAIIGILASVVLASLNDARALARDSVRRTELRQVQIALEYYYNEHGTYQVTNSGWNGGGSGWFGYENGSTYSVAISRVLYNEGFLSEPLVDAPFNSSATQPEYMMYLCDGGSNYSVSSTLERPTPEDITHIQSTCNGVGANGTNTRYGKNYAIERP